MCLVTSALSLVVLGVAVGFGYGFYRESKGSFGSLDLNPVHWGEKVARALKKRCPCGKKDPSLESAKKH